MKEYIVNNGVISSTTADEIQYEILADKVDNNSLMIENTSERKNRTLNSEYFTTNSRTIVNAINKTYKETQSAVDKATDAMTIVKDTVGDLENSETNTKLTNLKRATNENDLIGIVDKIYARPSGGVSADGGIELTQEEYDNLTDEEKMNGTTYFIKDAPYTPGVIDSEISEGSINAVSNKAIKKYVDEEISKIPSTIDTEMNDTSDNMVSNKVIKAYVDNKVKDYVDEEISKIPSTIDTEMSDTSNNMVANKVIKKYVDDSIPDNLRIDAEMSDTSMRPVQNKVLKKYVDDSVIYMNTTIDDFKTSVDNSYNAAYEANSLAVEAKIESSTANTNSSNAVNTANTANTTANNAVNTANDAKSIANTAKTNATTAIDTANDAKDIANSSVDSYAQFSDDVSAKVVELEELIRTYQTTSKGFYVGSSAPSDTSVIWVDTNY